MRQSMSGGGQRGAGGTQNLKLAPGSELSAQNLRLGSNSPTLRSWPEPKLAPLNDWATQAARRFFYFRYIILVKIQKVSWNGRWWKAGDTEGKDLSKTEHSSIELLWLFQVLTTERRHTFLVLYQERDDPVLPMGGTNVYEISTLGGTMPDIT